MSIGNISGDWVVFQTWNNVPQYKFNMSISDSGVITIQGGFTGIATKFPNTYLSLAISNSGNNSITSYLGNIVAEVMGGEMTGTDSSGNVYQGIWHAQKSSTLQVTEKEFGIGK